MKKGNRKRIRNTIATAAIATILIMPQAFAGTTSIANPSTKQVPQDLTSSAKLTIGVTGLSDTTFQNQQSNYQGNIEGNSAWRGFSHQGGRDITLTFSSPVDVQHISIETLQSPELGVYFPESVTFQIERDGIWYTIGTRQSAIPKSSLNARTQVFSMNHSQGYEADAVRIHLPVAVWVFARGLKVTGSQSDIGQAPGGVLQVAKNSSQTPGALSPQAPNAYGIKNMLLVETGDHGQLGQWTASDFAPMVGYIDPTGKMTSGLFDTMLFLPYGSVPNTESSLTNYLNDLFAPNQQLAALNQAVANTNATLNRPSYQENVVIGIPYFAYGTSDFGLVNGQDINFSGNAQDPNAVAARTQALQWYLNTLLQKWTQAGYTHLKLVGLYWDEEQYGGTHPGEDQYLQNAVSAVKSHQLPLFWIPFYGADKTDEWKTLGFDAAWIQPNYVEQGLNADILRISNAMATATRSGMGVEVELNGLDANNITLYQNSLERLTAEGFGMGQVSHAFYDGSKLLLDAEQSSNPTQRDVYDETASFVLGK